MRAAASLSMCRRFTVQYCIRLADLTRVSPPSLRAFCFSCDFQAADAETAILKKEIAETLPFSAIVTDHELVELQLGDKSKEGGDSNPVLKAVADAFPDAGPRARTE